MITHFDTVLNGLVAHWLVNDSRVVRTLVHQSAGDTSAQVTTWDAAGNVIDDHLFTVGDRILITLPVGQWLYEAAPAEGGPWHNVLGNQGAVNGHPDMLTGGPDVQVPVFVDNETEAAEVWSRCTLQGVPTPVPNSLPISKPQPVPKPQSNNQIIKPLSNNQIDMNKITLKIQNKPGVIQPLVFKFAPRRAAGAFAQGNQIALNFIVDPATPGRNCQAIIATDASKNIPEWGIIGNVNGAVILSDCFA